MAVNISQKELKHIKQAVTNNTIDDKETAEFLNNLTTEQRCILAVICVYIDLNGLQGEPVENWGENPELMRLLGEFSKC